MDKKKLDQLQDLIDKTLHTQLNYIRIVGEDTSIRIFQSLFKWPDIVECLVKALRGDESAIDVAMLDLCATIIGTLKPLALAYVSKAESIKDKDAVIKNIESITSIKDIDDALKTRTALINMINNIGSVHGFPLIMCGKPTGGKKND